MKHNSITTIKCRLSNSLHKILEPNIGVKKSQRFRILKKELTNDEKIKLFDEIVKLHKECSEEISSGLYKRREKRRIQAAREKRGYIPTKKTSKEDYEKTLQEH